MSLDYFGGVAGEDLLGDLGELPGRGSYEVSAGVFVEDPDEVEAVVGPMLRGGSVVPQDEISEVNDGLVFPAHEDDAFGGQEGIRELAFLSLAELDVDFEFEQIRNALDGQ